MYHLMMLDGIQLTKQNGNQENGEKQNRDSKNDELGLTIGKSNLP